MRHSCSGRASTLPDRLTLCFHGVGTPGRALEPDEAHCWVSPSKFAAMLDEVAEASGVSITFDDGNKSDAAIALPLLRERGLTATFFVLAGRLDTEGSMSKEDLRELIASGMSVGTHGFDHRPWRRMDAATTRRELVDARTVIAEALGEPVREAACPFGAYDRATLRSLRGLAYDRVYTVDGGYANSGSWLQTRRSIHDSDDASTVRALVRGPRRGALADPVAAAKRLAKRWR